jgi:hypothetical protein
MTSTKGTTTITKKLHDEDLVITQKSKKRESLSDIKTFATLRKPFPVTVIIIVFFIEL